VGPFLSNQLSVPTKDSVRGNKRRNLGKSASPDGLAADCKPATLIVGEPESSATELLLQDAVFFSEVFDNRILLTGDPAGHGGNKGMQRLNDGGHPSILPTQHDSEQPSAGWQTG